MSKDNCWPSQPERISESDTTCKYLYKYPTKNKRVYCQNCKYYYTFEMKCPVEGRKVLQEICLKTIRPINPFCLKDGYELFTTFGSNINRLCNDYKRKWWKFWVK